ncbi:RIC1-domain-containing protein [Suillus subluteus]|nr:RIC1-domain-containing protein [Suillus subluteus]
MYFPTSAARQLLTVPALPDITPEPVLCFEASPRKSLFCLLTRSSLTVWRVRPSAPLAHISRSETSLIEHGDNTAVTWSPDGSRIVIQTTMSYLILVTVDYVPDASAYQPSHMGPNVQRNFLPGPGEGTLLQSLSLALEGVICAEGQVLSVSPRKNYIIFSTSSPPAVQRIPWPVYDESEIEEQTARRSLMGHDTWILNDHELPWLVYPDVTVTKILHSISGVETWITSDGRAYFVRLQENRNSGNVSELDEEETDKSSTPNLANGTSRPSTDSSGSQSHYHWEGTCIHNFDVPRWVQKQRSTDDGSGLSSSTYIEPRRAVAIDVNTRFSLVAIGTESGSIEFTSFPTQDEPTPTPKVVEIPNPYNRSSGSVTAMEWSSDGYVLAVGWTHWLGNIQFQDTFMHAVENLFWAPGNFELVFVLPTIPKSHAMIIEPDGQVFVLPFAKSATTCQHSPDNTRYAFLQMDDRALVYRGAEQPDMSVINPESDVWQHIKIPQSYLATNWPIKYSALSSLVHYSSTSGRWKIFSSIAQEQAFTVKGGLLWFHHVLIACSGNFQIRLYSRDMELSNLNVLHREVLMSPVIILSLVDNSLLVYTADNMLSHYLIIPTADTIKLHLCGSITFDGIIALPSAVRALSWMIPNAQKRLGDPVDDLAVATVLMVVGGQLVLLRPRKSGTQEVNYDMQIFADRIEFCWIHLRGIGALENSLWGYDGQNMRVWLNALAIESSGSADEPSSVKESVSIPLDFYPLSVLMDKGIIIGAEHEAATRMNLSFVMFRHATSSHLFLHHVLRYHLESGQVKEAVTLAKHYQHLVFFAHALEILLHTVVESESTVDSEYPSTSTSPESGTLAAVIEFLDHFDASLDVVVGCARKTEMTRWKRLFSIVGNPHALFETCLASKRLKTAGSYLLVLHNLEQLDENNKDAVRLLNCAVKAQDWQLCRELLRFLHSIDDTGKALRHALSETSLVVQKGVVVP